jgi:hypothetical protein
MGKFPLFNMDSRVIEKILLRPILYNASRKFDQVLYLPFEKRGNEGVSKVPM